MSTKRNSCRAIIIEKDSIVAMYREKNDRIYYTFPGGGMEENETEKECVVREALEEFGITVEPVKKVYIYEDETSIQHFYLCKWISGNLGEGEGEEFQDNRNRGVYIPVLMSIEKIPSLPLMPPQVAKQLLEDLAIYGKDLDQNEKHIVAK